MSYFTDLHFLPAQSAHRTTLSEVLPIGEGWSYFVVLADAYLSSTECEAHIKNFRDLQEAIGCDDALQALEIARGSGKLTEGRHELPDIVANYLGQYSTGPVGVRRWRYGETKSTTEKMDVSAINDAWFGSDTEEIEVVDQSGQWYLRIKDVDPLIFLAARTHSLADEIRRCNAYCREVSGSFEYAR